MLARGSPRERIEIRLVVQRLTAKFSAVHPADHIAEVVDDSYRVFDNARVRDFVPLLTERRAHRELAKAAGSAS
ncbi:three-helix bundle dimerization domain-containing protein [Amycolatopsis sp. NPDC004079]|uniref:three-helix bundle dimerization domain-containing protein n=1 Tax=Amycolatopsis sp. NPDC004079 TaxID=3154549 RepID=UPI0033B781C5